MHQMNRQQYKSSRVQIEYKQNDSEKFVYVKNDTDAIVINDIRS